MIAWFFCCKMINFFALAQASACAESKQQPGLPCVHREVLVCWINFVEIVNLPIRLRDCKSQRAMIDHKSNIRNWRKRRLCEKLDSIKTKQLRQLAQASACAESKKS